MLIRVLLLALLCAVSANQDDNTSEEEEEEEVWPACDTIATDKESSNPNCDPCSPHVYTEFNDAVQTEVFQSYTTALKNYQLRGWIRFMMGTGKVIEDCPLMYSCGSTYPTWLRTQHPAEDEGITEGEMCTHFTNGNCCTHKEDVHVKNCGNYYVYLLTYNKPMTSSYSNTYCIEPLVQPDVCNDAAAFSLLEDTTNRGELETSTSTASEPIDIANDNRWYTFTAGRGTIKRTCPGIHHCGFKYPMWIDGEYPTEEGEIVMRMGHAANSEANVCAISSSQPLYIVKCGDKFYHKLDKVVTYSAFCVDEDYSDLCESAETLSETWRGTTVDKARDHCDTNGLTDFSTWYRIGAHQKKMPDHCVAPNRCGADNGYFVAGNLGHPDPGDGIVGRIFYYSTAASCTSATGAVQGHILNCGDQDEDDYIYKWNSPSGCDKVFCAEENPCSSTVYTKLDDPGRASREYTTATINDINTKHGWYRFTKGEGIMPRSPVLPGHSAATYAGWYDGEYPLETGEEKIGRACFVNNANDCWNERQVTVRNCNSFFVYHLKTTAANCGYTYEQDVCKLDTMSLDEEWRLQYNLDAVVVSDSTLTAGWYEVTIGSRELATERTLYKHGGAGKYPGWMDGGHPTEEEGIVERTVYFTTTDVNPIGGNTKVYVRNCGDKYLYYLRPYSANYFYAIAQPLCQEGSYKELDQDYRLYSNPSEQNNLWNNDQHIFKTFTAWYRFTNGNGRLAEFPKISGHYYGGFKYPYQFPAGSHDLAPNAGDIAEDILMENYQSATNPSSTAQTWRISIANCGNYFLYRIPPTTRARYGLVVDDNVESVCNANRYTETDDNSRLVSSTNPSTGTSDFYLDERWYRLTAGLGYIPTSVFIGTQCSSTYHGHLRDEHPARDEGIVENLVQFRSTTATSIHYNRIVWVKQCDGFYVYRLRESNCATCRYCEATPGCNNARELEHFWRVNSRKVLTGQYESKSFGNDGWVYFTTGLGRMPEAPPPKTVGGCTYNGYIDSHPTQQEGAVPRTMRFPGNTKEVPIQVENCGDKYVYFLSSSITNDYCYVADTDVCSEDVYTAVHEERRLHYSHKYGTAFTRFDLDNQFNGWIRYTMGLGRMMEEPPALTDMCYTEHQGWINGSHPTENEGVVRRQVCWKYGTSATRNCHETDEISIKNCGGYYVYGISKPPANNQYGYCVEQDKTEVCEGATILNNEKRGMLTPTTEYIHDQTTILEDAYYRFTSRLGRLTAFPVKSENCGGKYRMLIKERLEKDEVTGDALFALQQHTTGWTGTVYRNVGLQCDGYWVYRLFHVNVNQLAYCVEEDVCESSEIKNIYSTNYLQWLEERDDNEWHVLSTGWYQVKVGNKRLAYSPSDLYDCSATYPGYVKGSAPTLTEGIVDGEVCYRTSDTSNPSTCQDIYQKKCPNKELYYLKKSPSASYALCVETDVCESVEGTPFDDTWRLSDTPAAAGGSDTMAIGWYRVSIGNEKLATSREEAKCGALYPGWMTLGRHPNVTEGTVNTEICYNTGGTASPNEANCKEAQVVNCGSHYLYHLRPATTNYGLCISSSDDSMCHNYNELNEAWRSTEYSAEITNSDTTLPSGWYRFTVGLGRMAFHCPAYQHGGGYYPSYISNMEELPPVDAGVVSMQLYWATTSSCTYSGKTGYVKNCGEYPVYWLPKQTTGHTTYNTEANSCADDQYTVLDDSRRLAWRPTTDFQGDNLLSQGWYKFENGLNKINEECTPPSYGGTWYPGWMEGGHPAGDGEVVDRTVYFRHGVNCKQSNTKIKVKRCGSFYLYRLVATASQRGYTVASEPCDADPMTLDEEDRSIYTRSTTYTHDNSKQEGWYQFTTGTGVMPKSPPFQKSCKTNYPVWLNGEDPSQEEGVVTRVICAVNGAVECQWQKDIKVRNCGNNKMLYYFYVSPPHTSARYCVDDTMDNVCNSATPLDETWRGANRPGTGHSDKTDIVEGWYKFTAYNQKMANYPVPYQYCGSTYPVYMDGEHVQRGSCASQTIRQVNSNTNWNWRNGEIYECQCMNGDFIYYHIPAATPLTGQSAYCVEQDPCTNFDRFTGSNRSPWQSTVVSHGDNARQARWVKLTNGLGTMPTYTIEQPACGSTYGAWYDGEHPTEVGQMTRGQYCFVTSATATCSSPRDARVLKCDGGEYLYHVLPTVSASYGYCADEDVCDWAYEEWGREENNRLRHTSISGYYSATRQADNALPNQWYRITSGLERLPTECVGYMSCGVLYPGWMNGEHPAAAERVVDREVCFVQAPSESCCAATKTIKVVNCVRDDEQFYLYRLYKTAANQAYCIDESSSAVCDIGDNDIQHLNDERHGTGHYRDSTFRADYQIYPIPGWFQVTVHQRTLIHYPPIQYFCGGVQAGWVEAPQPGPNDGVVSSRSCYRTSTANEDCGNPMPLKMKNCDGTMRYLYAPHAATTRNMCVEENICEAANHEVFTDQDWRLAFTKTVGTDYETDYRRMDTSPYRGWFRFEGIGNDRITEVQQEYMSCGTQYPGWLSGGHPSADEGVVKRLLYLTTSATAYTGRNSEIFVKNCGDFMLYNINFNFYTGNWGICVDTDVCDADVTELEESHRLQNTWGVIAANDDASLTRGWYRFTNGFEKMPESCPIADSCGSKKPGYLSQPHPAIGEGIVERKVCFGDADQCCVASRDILVKNCGTHFVYRLYPTTTYEKYCVEEAADGMCNDESYAVIEDDRRGENNPYDSADKFDDSTLASGWYRFTSFTGRIPEYSSSSQMCGAYYPGYLENKHPARTEGVQNNRVCFSTSLVNEGQSCRAAQVKNCGSYYVYQLTRSSSWHYGLCVAQDQCTDATELDDRWRLIVNPKVSGQTTAADNTLKKGWYRFPIGHGTMPDYEGDTNYGGATNPSYMLGDLPSVDDGEVKRTARFAGTTSNTREIRVKNCGEHYIYWLQPTASAAYVYSIDTDVCLHAFKLAEEWRNQFYISEGEDDRHTDYNRGKDWYQFPTGFKMMAEAPPLEQYSCGTLHPAYLNQGHPTVEDGVVPREVCYKEDEIDNIYQACFAIENIRVKNCGEFYAYQLNPVVQEGAYCVYNRQTSCEPKVVHAKYGELAVVNCTLNSEKDFDSSEVSWTKLNSMTLPDASLSNIEISENKLLLRINDIADDNAGVYALYIPSTSTHELVEVVLYNAVEASHKYYVVEEGEDVQIDVTFNIQPPPTADQITWKKLPNKHLNSAKYSLNDDKSSLTISGVTASEAGTYRCQVQFEVDGVSYMKHSDVIVQLAEEE